MQAHRTLIAIAVLVLAACASEATGPGPEPPSLPRLDLPGAVSTRTIGVADVAEPAPRPDLLRDLLVGAGFEAAAERTWADRTAGVRLITIRAVRFETERGAMRFDGWLGEHGAELIGGGTAADPLGPMLAHVYRHEPDDCCPNKDTTWLLSAWREGRTVWTVMIGGPGADRSVLSDLLEEVA